MKSGIVMAPHSGFCFGVKRATDKLEEKLNSKRQCERIFTLGNLIHNEIYMAMLERRGVSVTSLSELESLAATATEESPVTVFIRAHGITKETECLLISLSENNPYFSFDDCTCPFVSRIHDIAKDNSDSDKFVNQGFYFS